MVAVSARTGAGLDELKAALAEAAGEERERTSGPARLYVDRVFTLHGIGTVATGTLWSGSIGAGDELRAEPSGLDVRVRSVEVHDAPTRWGRVSYAVRWHGARPALLWHLEQREGVAGPWRITAPRFDPSWSTTEARGEALLAPVEPVGGLPGVLRPLAAGTPAAAVPDAGSFG